MKANGLVHVSLLSNKFVRDAREVVKTGDIVKVKVLEIDQARQRVGLTMRMDAPVPVAGDAAPAPRGTGGRRPDGRGAGPTGARGGREAAPAGAMAAAFAKLAGTKS